jgi:hypothetical protein
VLKKKQKKKKNNVTYTLPLSHSKERAVYSFIIIKKEEKYEMHCWAGKSRQEIQRYKT